jgi:hypothetical protein
MPNAEQHQRKHPRVKAPKGLVVAWQTGSKRKLSYLQSMAMGGLFIGTPNPAPLNSPLKLLLDLPVGEVNARAIVRHIKPNRGMGVEFVSMGQEDRARLSQMLRPLLKQ